MCPAGQQNKTEQNPARPPSISKCSLVGVEMNLNGAPWGPLQAERPSVPPVLVGKTPVSMTLLSLSSKRRSEQLLLEGGAASEIKG